MLTKLVFCLLLLLSGVPVAAQDAPAATLVDDFDTGYDSGEVTGQWWTYSDETGSSFAVSLDTGVYFNGAASMRMDVEVAASGYAGAGFDFSFVRDWQDGDGIVMHMFATAENLPLILVLHLDDDTQTSTLSPGVTPFGCEFTTPAGSAQAWVTVTLPWDCFQRLYWVGQEGITEFTPYLINAFEFGFDPADDQPLSGSIWVDDIRVLSEVDLNQPPSFTDLFADLPVVRVSQVGYRPDDRKVFVAIVPVLSFSIVDQMTGESVYIGSAVHQDFDQDAQQDIYRGRFDSFTTPGSYRIVLPDGQASYPFTIAEDVYTDPMILAARALYLQRSGMAISDASDSGVELEAGHTEPALLWGQPDAAPIDVSGGWYDAGDFGRYIPTAAFAVNQLLYGFEANPDFFADGSLNIPESGNGQPDLLDEIRWELDWLLKMQREDGAVHHKVTTRSFPGFGALPAEDDSQLYLFDVTSDDTAYFAAVMAQAARTFEPYDATYAADLLVAAERAGAWLEQHPDPVPPGGFQNPPPSEYPMQGGYDFIGVQTIPRLWAAAELFNTTGNPAYETAFAGYFADTPTEFNHSMSWANAYPQALYAYLTAVNTNPDTAAAVTAVFQAQADAIYNVTFQSGYGVALNDRVPGYEYVWGSNQVALAHGLYLMLANSLFPNERYEQAAITQIHYVLGVNPVAKAYISGIGANPMLYPHHNVSYRMQQAVPGFITEGSNSQSSGGDAVLEGLWEIEVPVAMRYSDDWESWASNEPTIDANATFVALLAHWV